MPIYATKEAHSFWNNLPYTSRARSLGATHFAFIGESRSDKEWRKLACDQIQTGCAETRKADSHKIFVNELIEQGAATIFGKLEARLILNAADGVIENGGICLDRNSGLPYIPGSAVKAAARRYALQELGNADSEDEKATLLTQIALTFGFGITEWKSGRDIKHAHSHSDFWLAMTPLSEPGVENDSSRDLAWSTVSEKAAAAILRALKREPKDPDSSLASQLPNLAGGIHFLPAFPTNQARIESDILTPHHSNYYAGKQSVATDDEDPVPLFFPTVAKGTSYQFVLNPSHLPHAADSLEQAKNWLSHAITILGIGAKTNAGYGWFSIDAGAQNKADSDRQEKAAAAKRKEELDALPPEERTQEELKELSHEDFVKVIKNLEKEEPDQQKVVCQMLTGSKKAEWKAWKKAKRWKPLLPSIREVAKSHGIELS